MAHSVSLCTLIVQTGGKGLPTYPAERAPPPRHLTAHVHAGTHPHLVEDSVWPQQHVPLLWMHPHVVPGPAGLARPCSTARGLLRLTGNCPSSVAGLQCKHAWRGQVGRTCSWLVGRACGGESAVESWGGHAAGWSACSAIPLLHADGVTRLCFGNMGSSVTGIYYRSL